MRKQAAKNVLMKDGKARRVPGDRADELIESGQAKHHISNTVYRAMKLGIEVGDPKTRDEKGVLRAKIKDARLVEAERHKKRKDKREKKERDERDASDEADAHDD